jgi:hypothetical protein
MSKLPIAYSEIRKVIRDQKSWVGDALGCSSMNALEVEVAMYLGGDLLVVSKK